MVRASMLPGTGMGELSSNPSSTSPSPPRRSNQLQTEIKKSNGTHLLDAGQRSKKLTAGRRAAVSARWGTSKATSTAMTGQARTGRAQPQAHSVLNQVHMRVSENRLE